VTVRSTGSSAGERKAARAAKARADGNGMQPQASLRIIETRVYRGPNYWSYDPAIKLIVDLGVLEAFPSNTIPGFVDGLLELMPAVGQHSCSTGRPGGFEKRLREGTWLGHVAEHVAL
jgi:cyanophycin synthetase